MLTACSYEGKEFMGNTPHCVAGDRDESGRA